MNAMQIDRYIPPSGHPLHPYVDSIWRAVSQPKHASETILPKQNVDILFNLGAPYAGIRGASSSRSDIRDFHVAGPQTSSFVVRPQGDAKLLGISLKMDGCSAILALPLTELTDQTVEGTMIFSQQRFLWEQVAEAQSFDAQRDLLVRWLMARLQPKHHVDLVQYACRALREQPSSNTLDRLSSQLNLSSRHLRRIMLHHLGIGPAHYMRLSRFVKALHMMPKAYSLTDIAYTVYYADQAHFCRDFKAIAGMTPQEYRKRMSQVPGHIFST
jgi:AraC-like DNA-binding protein